MRKKQICLYCVSRQTGIFGCVQFQGVHPLKAKMKQKTERKEKVYMNLAV